MARRSVREQRFSWSSCEEAVGRSALISATQTPLCSPKALACLLSCMCANVWHVSGVLMRWIWLVASTDAMDALGVAPAVRTWQLLCEGDPLGCSTRQVLLVQLLQLRDLCSLPRLLRLRRCWLAALTWWPPRSRGRHRKKRGALQFQPRAGPVAQRA